MDVIKREDAMRVAMWFGRRMYKSNFIKKRVMEIPAVDISPHWTSCKKELPKETGVYLVIGKWRNEPAKIWLCQFCCFGGTYGWINSVDNPMVQAWMTLPKDYEGE